MMIRDIWRFALMVGISGPALWASAEAIMWAVRRAKPCVAIPAGAS
jgi:hypothetical protein